jgi:hypothetical protein
VLPPSCSAARGGLKLLLPSHGCPQEEHQAAQACTAVRDRARVRRRPRRDSLAEQGLRRGPAAATRRDACPA